MARMKGETHGVRGSLGGVGEAHRSGRVFRGRVVDGAGRRSPRDCPRGANARGARAVAGRERPAGTGYDARLRAGVVRGRDGASVSEPRAKVIEKEGKL